VASYAGYIAVAAYAVYGSVDARRKQRKAAAQARAEYNASLQDRTVTTLTADPPWQIIYGQCRVGGAVVAILTSDKTAYRTNGTTYTRPDSYKHLVIVLAAHQVQAINEVYIDGVAVGTLDGNGWATTGDFKPATKETRKATVTGTTLTLTIPAVTIVAAYSTSGVGVEVESVDRTANVSISGGGYTLNNSSGTTVYVTYEVTTTAGVVNIQKHLGTDAQTVDTFLTGVCPTEWDNTHRLRGLAYVVVTLDLEYPQFQGGPPQMSFDVSGKLVYDPRTSTTAYSYNPALCARDWITGDYGLGIPSADVDDASVIAAANACDATITLLPPIGGSGARYRCDGAADTDASAEAVLDDICASMAGYAYPGATWYLMAGAWTSSVMSLTDDHLDGQISVTQGGMGIDETFNGIRYSFIPNDSAVQTNQMYQNATFVTADGRELWTALDFPFIADGYRSRNVARIMVERSRDALVISYPAKMHAWPLQVGDRVAITSGEYGWSAKTFRVTDWQFGISSPVQLTLQEDDSTIWDLADAGVSDPAPNTGLPNPWVVAALSGLAANSGTAHLLRQSDGTIVPRVWVSWNAVTDKYVTISGGAVNVRWLRPGTDEWMITRATGDALGVYITDVHDGDVLSIEAWPENSLGATGAKSLLKHVVLGKTEVPSNVSGLTATKVTNGVRIDWTACPDIDYDETELRRGGTGWADASPLVGSVSMGISGNSYLWVPAAGTYTIRAKHIDTSGNASASAASVAVTVSATDLLEWGDVSGRPMLFRVAARGYSSTLHPLESGVYNGETGAELVNEGNYYTVVKIDRTTGAVTNVGASTNGTTLAGYLDSITGSGWITVVFSYEEPLGPRNAAFLTAMYKHGASRAVIGSPLFAYRSAYILVGISNCAEGNGFEAYNGTGGEGGTNDWCDVSFYLQNFNLVISGTTATPRSLQDYAYTGAMDATKGATWGTDITSQPADAALMNSYVGGNLYFPAIGAQSVSDGVYGTVLNYIRYEGNDYGTSFQPGEYLTLSADLWCEDGSTAGVGQEASLFIWFADTTAWTASNHFSNNTTTKYRYSCTIQVPASAADFYYIGIGLYHQGPYAETASVGKIWCDRIQVERGQVATAYSPRNVIGEVGTPQMEDEAATVIGADYVEEDDRTSTSTYHLICSASVTNDDSVARTALISGVSTMDYTINGIANSNVIRGHMLPSTTSPTSGNFKYQHTIVSGEDRSFQWSAQEQVSVAAGATITWELWGWASSYTSTMYYRNSNLRIELIKR
jgi:hypothetical protein